MTQIDFYLLSTGGPDNQHLYACRLAEKAYNKGHQVYILTGSESETQHLDEQLWTFREDNFLPHGPYPEAMKDQAPILVGHDTNPQGPADVLINLRTEVPMCFSSFSRVAELVDSDETRRHNARERYRFYKERGYKLNTHNI